MYEKADLEVLQNLWYFIQSYVLRFMLGVNGRRNELQLTSRLLWGKPDHLSGLGFRDQEAPAGGGGSHVGSNQLGSRVAETGSTAAGCPSHEPRPLPTIFLTELREPRATWVSEGGGEVGWRSGAENWEMERG